MGSSTQVLDEGKLTDSKGREVDFTNTIIIMTSNIGAAALAESNAHANDPAVEQGVINQVRHHFSPEFVNRIGRLRPSFPGSPVAAFHPHRPGLCRPAAQTS